MKLVLYGIKKHPNTRKNNFKTQLIFTNLLISLLFFNTLTK